MRRLAILAALCLVGGCGFFGPRVKPDVSLAGEPVGNYTLFHLRRLARELALFMDQPSRAATLSPRTWELIPARAGRRMLIESTLRKVLAAPPGARVQPVVRRVIPSGPRLIRPVEIGRYQTPILDAQAPRVYNLTQAARALDCQTVVPGQTFSLNALVDTPAMRSRYRPAPVIGDSGETRLEPGGGVCQLATTLYNAVMAAHLAVVEVHRHSKPVRYVPAGRDATIYTDKDFRFKNDRGKEVKIRAQVAAGMVLVRILIRPQQENSKNGRIISRIGRPATIRPSTP